MSRNENESLSGLIVPETDEVITKFIDKSGQNSEEYGAVGKITQVHNKEKDKVTTNYFIKLGRGMLFDPYGMDANKVNAYNFQFKKVDERVYSLYIQYLKTRRVMFLTHAQREYQNKGY